MLPQYRQNNFLDYYQSNSVKVRVVDGPYFAHGFIHGQAIPPTRMLVFYYEIR